MSLKDVSSERAVLSGIIKYGEKAYFDIADILRDSTFTVDSNEMIYKCLQNIFEKRNNLKIDLASILSSAKELGLDHTLSKKEEALHLKAIMDFPVNEENIRIFAVKIRKLEIARLLYKELEVTRDKLMDINGNESISKIIGIAEDSIFNFSSNLDNDSETDPEILSNGLDEYINGLKDNPVDQIGIPTGFDVYDQAIGGGLRRGTINVIGARPKVGKTLLSDNIGYNIAKRNIPVLNMDTEMTKKDHIHRILAMSTEIELNKIETGKFNESPSLANKIERSVEEVKKMPFYHKSIAGKSFDEQISIMRRWLVKEVGLNDDGSAKDCVIFYDYLKLMDTSGIDKDLKEYQVLGFMMTELHNFAVKYRVPIMAFVQLNRDGITKESTDSASGSDRIIWLCSNFTIFKRKSDEEIAEDGADAGNRKLVPLISRHGGGLDDNDYINCKMKGWCAKITEGKTRLELMRNGGNDDGFVLDEKNEEEIPFV